jgi:UDP-glucose 4-epimerase
MNGVLVTHADRPIGRRIVEALARDPRVERVVAVGSGRPPRSFAAGRNGGVRLLRYLRVDLSRPRDTATLLRPQRLAALGVDAIVHVPRHGSVREAAVPAQLAERRMDEAQRVLQHALEAEGVRTLVALGSAFVYRLVPGNANHVTEESPLELDPDAPAALRAWVACDGLFGTEAAASRLRTVLLRLPAVVDPIGSVHLHPALERAPGTRPRPAGFDPLCPVVADEDVARAVAAALAGREAGVFHVGGTERLPLSLLGRCAGRPGVPLPGPLLSAAARVGALLGAAPAPLDGPHVRYGLSLDGHRALARLGFEPRYRIGLTRAGDGGLRLETAGA